MKPWIEIELDRHYNRTGDMWHILIGGELGDFSYGFRLDGPSDPGGSGLFFDPEKILLDPYSRALLPRTWGEPARYGEKPCCKVPPANFDWQDDKHPRTPLSDTVIYELHVRGFSQSDSSRVKAPGTYLGIIEKIPYLKDLGVTAWNCYR